jgi:hypothetical protein
MKLQNKKLEDFLAKAEKNPELMEILKGIMFYCQAASEMGIPLDEVAAVGTVGWTVGQDPKLKEMLKHLIKMSEMGIESEH